MCVAYVKHSRRVQYTRVWEPGRPGGDAGGTALNLPGFSRPPNQKLRLNWFGSSDREGRVRAISSGGDGDSSSDEPGPSSRAYHGNERTLVSLHEPVKVCFAEKHEPVTRQQEQPASGFGPSPVKKLPAVASTRTLSSNSG